MVLLPRRTVAGEVAAPGLDLNQADAGWRDQNDIDLIDRSVAGDELTIGSGAEGIQTRQDGVQPSERCPFPGELGRRALSPARVVQCSSPQYEA